MFIAPGITRPQRIKRGLYARWDINDLKSYSGAGSVVTDLAQTYDVNLINSPSVLTLPDGLEFNGTTQYMESDDLANSTEKSDLASCTFDMWLTPRVASNSRKYYWTFTDPTAYPIVGLAYSDIARPEPAQWEMFAGTAGSARYRLFTDNSFGEEITNVCITKLTGGSTATKYNIKIYINGQEETTYLTDTVKSDPWMDNLSALNRFRIMAIIRHNQNFSEGDFYEMSIYNRVLTSNEVAQNFAASRGKFGV